MIYIRPADEDRLDQGDILDDCPILRVDGFKLNEPASVNVGYGFHRVLVVTQTCDLALDKATVRECGTSGRRPVSRRSKTTQGGRHQGATCVTDEFGAFISFRHSLISA